MNKKNRLALGTISGIVLGTAIGFFFDNITLGLCLGIAIGVLPGAATSNKKKDNNASDKKD